MLCGLGKVDGGGVGGRREGGRKGGRVEGGRMEGKVEVRRENGREGMNEGKWEGVRGEKRN